MPDRTPRETALAYMEAWNAMDAAACAACFAEDGVREGRILARATAGGARFPRFRADWGVWTARGECVDVPAVSIYRVAGALIAEEAEYIDPAVMMTPPD